MRAIVIGSKYALSSTRSVVAALTSELRPPMMPAIASGFSAVRNQQVGRLERAPHVVERDELAVRAPPGAWSARRTTIRRAAICALSKACNGCPKFEHHVVGRVDHVVQRAHSAQLQPPAHPERRGANFHSANRQRRVARAELGREDLDRNAARSAAWLPRALSIAALTAAA